MSKKTNGQTPLMHACMHDPAEALRLIELSSDFDLNVQNKRNGMTALMYACVRKHRKNVISALLERNVSLETRDKKELTVLMRIVYFTPSFIEYAQMLIEKGANMDHLNKHEISPILIACFFSADEKCFNLAKLFVENDANVNVVGKKGMTALKCALSSASHSNLGNELICKIVSAGADANEDTKNVMPPLHFAHDKDVLKILLDAGADINYHSMFFGTVLSWNRKSLENTKFLVEAGAIINYIDKDGNVHHFYQDITDEVKNYLLSILNK